MMELPITKRICNYCGSELIKHRDLGFFICPFCGSVE